MSRRPRKKWFFEFSNEDETGWPSPDGLDRITDGYMRHHRDTQGLLAYLLEMGIARPSDTLKLGF